MILSIIILSLSLVLDGLLSNYMPFMFSSLSYFTPLFTVISLFFFYSLQKNEKHYFILIAIFGFLYDLSYTNLLIWHIVLFLLLGYIIKKCYQFFTIRFFPTLLILLGLIILYDTFNALFIFCFQLFPITFLEYYQKIVHSILLNIGYGIILYLLLYKRIKKPNKTTVH